MQAVRIFNKGCGRDRRELAIVMAFGVNRKTSRRTELTNTNAAIHLSLAQYRFPRARPGPDDDGSEEAYNAFVNVTCLVWVWSISSRNGQDGERKRRVGRSYRT